MTDRKPDRIADAATEARMRDAALVLMDLAIEAVGPDGDQNTRFVKALSVATQALLMGDELMPGATLAERKRGGSPKSTLFRLTGVAMGLGHAVGCIRHEEGRRIALQQIDLSRNLAMIRCDAELTRAGF